MHTPIKSFVLRTGRMSARQQQGLKEYFKDYQLKHDEGVWDFPSMFKDFDKIIVEIGFGMGASLLEMAKSQPDNMFIGIEVHRAGVGTVAADIHEQQLNNIKLIMHDAVEIMIQCIANDSLDGIQIFFPDPWPKKRHHKRRLIQPALINLLSSKLKSGGFIHCATDWEPYAQHMLLVLENEPALYNDAGSGCFSPRPSTRPMTKFEQRGLDLGHGVFDLYFIRR